MKHLRLSYTILLPTILFMVACNRIPDPPTFEYPSSRVWAHRCNDTLTAQQKAQYFEGIELDVVFSDHQKELFVGHELRDTLQAITLQQWMQSFPQPERHWFWIDLKNLTRDNASVIAQHLARLAHQFGYGEHMIVEHYSPHALKILKQSGIHTCLWVDNAIRNQRSPEEWRKSTAHNIRYLNPDAISCEHVMLPLLTESFPNQNIQLWHTPADYNDTNIAITRQLLNAPGVKVVLVDYDRWEE